MASKPSHSSVSLPWAWRVSISPSIRRAAAPLALCVVALHLLFKCSSWRYTASLTVLDLSPSVLLAFLSLLCWPTTLWGTQPDVKQQAAGSAVLSCSTTVSAVQSFVIQDDSVGRPGSARPPSRWKRLWRKITGSAVSFCSSATHATVLRRQGQPRSSTDNGPQSPSSAGRPFWRQHSKGTGDKWQPSMTRITSGQHLAIMDDTSSSVATSVGTSRQRGSRVGARPPSKDPGGDLPLVPHTGHLAVDCVHHDTTLPQVHELTQVITSQHLLQFGALLGESSAELALSQAGAPSAQGRQTSCLLGATDNEVHWAQGWEQIVNEALPARGLHYSAWRRYLRKGLFMYKSRTVFEGVTPQQLVAFQFDVEHKPKWEDSCAHLQVIAPPKHVLDAISSTNGADMSGSDSCGEAAVDWTQECFARSAYLYARTRFPAPMAQREYVYARRVWAKADDGGCYMLSRCAPYPTPPKANCRTLRVQDFISGMVIRTSSLGHGPGPASEVITLYFEDSHVASGIMNLGVRKALWPAIQKMEGALRAFVVSPRGATLQVSASAAMQQACLPPGSHHAPILRRCASAAGSCRGSMDGQAQQQRGAGGSAGGAAPTTTPVGSSGGALESPAGLMQTLSLRLPRSLMLYGSDSATSGVDTPGAGRHFLSGFASPATTPSYAVSRPTPTPRRTAVCMVQQLSPSPAPSSGKRAAIVAAAAWLWSWFVAVLALIGVVLRPWLWVPALRRTPAPVIGQSSTMSMSGPAASGVSRVSSHPVEGLLSRSGGGARKWGRHLVGRLALVAVRAVSLPLAHKMLSRSAAAAAAGGGERPPLSRCDSMSMSSSYGGATMVAQHAGRPGAAGTQASIRESKERVRNWLDPASSPDYLMGQHAELIQHHIALQQLQEQQQLRRRQQQQQPPHQHQGGARAGPGLSLRPLLGTVVVDGVAMGWERPSMVRGSVDSSDKQGLPAGTQGKGRGGRNL